MTVEADQISVSVPLAPNTVEETGIGFNLLLGLMFKSMYMTGTTTSTILSEELKLSRAIIDSLLAFAKDKLLVEVLGALHEEQQLTLLRYALTDTGRDWASDALTQSQYIGPAPVSLDDYRRQVQNQLIGNESIDYRALKSSFSQMVMPQELVDLLGPAINSGRSMLLFGPPGNGKTMVGHAIQSMFKQTIYVPHCLEVDNQIIKLFDATVHVLVDGDPESSETVQLRQRQAFDPRWSHCYRPVVTTGGELTLDMLDLIFNPYAKYYEAPMQLKATGGIFIIDDFGRQIVGPQEVLNRWIVPLELRVDYLTLHTGKKFAAPFDELVMFSTNIPPRDLMDAGSYRRIQYKIEIGAPNREDYVEIFRQECARHDFVLPDDVIRFLFDEFYPTGVAPLARFHPKFIIEQALSICEYQGIPPHLDRGLVEKAVVNL